MLGGAPEHTVCSVQHLAQRIFLSLPCALIYHLTRLNRLVHDALREGQSSGVGGAAS